MTGWCVTVKEKREKKLFSEFRIVIFTLLVATANARTEKYGDQFVSLFCLTINDL